jgi:hypothetical protein
MYYSGKNPLRKVTRNSEPVIVPKGLKQRRLHKAFLRYHDPDNWPLLRKTLKEMGRADLIGNSKNHLVPNFQPRGTGEGGESRRRKSNRGARSVESATQPFRTQHTRYRGKKK